VFSADNLSILIPAHRKCVVRFSFAHFFFSVAFQSTLFFLILCSCNLTAKAQFLDSIQSSLQNKPSFIGGFATKSTFIGGFRSPIFTAKAGLDFDNRIRFGVGVSWLKLGAFDIGKDNTPFYLDKIILTLSGIDTIHPSLQFRYINLFVEYVYYNSSKWQFSIPIKFGVGDSRYKYIVNGDKFIENKHAIILYEPAVSGQYKILPWFGLGLDVGYRIMLVSNNKIGSKFNSPVYDIKVLIFWGELYKKIIKPN